MNCHQGKRLTVFAGLYLLQTIAYATNQWQLNMPQGVTPISKDIYDLHMLAMAICGIIGIVVFGVMIYTLIHHRKSRGHQAATFYHNTKLEIFWTIIPFLILTGLAVPATRLLARMDDTKASDVTIKIIGYQWKWEYEYLDEGIKFFSNLATPYEQIHNKSKKSKWYLLEVDKPMVIPVNKKVRFLVTSNDVIHSWWVPDLGVKRDAIPGFIHEAWAKVEKPGTYRGQCAELCGVNHGFMPIVVEAVSEEDYKAWVARQPKVQDVYAQKENKPVQHAAFDKNYLMKKGKVKYEQYCAACHRPDGQGIPPMYPALKGSSVAVGTPISRHILLVLNGVAGTAMQAFKNQLSDEEIAAVVTYERNAWGNNTNDVIQPEEVAKQREVENAQPAKKVKMTTVGGLR